MTPGNLLCFHSVVQRCLQGRLAHSAAYTHQSANLSSFKSCHEKTLWLHLHRWRVQSCIDDVYTPVFYVYVLMTCTLLCWWRNLSCVTGVYIHVLMVCTLWQVWVCAFGCCFVSANGLLVDVCQCCCLLMFVCLPLSRHFPWIWIWTDITFWDGIIPQAAEINMWRYKTYIFNMASRSNIIGRFVVVVNRLHFCSCWEINAAFRDPCHLLIKYK